MNSSLEDWGRGLYSAGRRQIWGHSLKGSPISGWQTLSDHSFDVAEKARNFSADCVGAEMSEWVWLAGILHDAGKTRTSFQEFLYWSNKLPSNYVYGEDKDHLSVGALLLREWNKTGKAKGLPPNIIFHLIAGHHGGLRDSYCDSFLSQMEWYKDLASYLSESERNGQWKNDIECMVNPPPVFPEPVADFPKKSIAFALFVRMCHSCLVDADCLDTERFMNRRKYDRRSQFDNISRLMERMAIHLKKFDNPKTVVDKIRCSIQNEYLGKASLPPGFFSSTVPTGGGKTLGAMAWALSHAVAHGKRRVIYLLPYTSIIEQNAGVFRNAIGAENVVEHHSVVESVKNTEENQLAADNWDAPVIVSTNVQFWETLFGRGNGRLRKLHNIANSVIIMDECQMIPPQYVGLAVETMQELVGRYGCSILFSTATQPQFPSLTGVVELMSDPQNLADRLKRVELHWPNSLKAAEPYADVVDRLISHESFLCVVNKRNHARFVFDMVRSKSQTIPVYHLSARMCPDHRTKKIAEIKELLIQKKPVRVVSTQLVEAGVDFDFPVVFRAFAGLDSIWQAAGRCNREGKLSIGHVHVFVPEDNAMPGTLGSAMEISRNMFSTNNVDFSRPTGVFERFFGELYKKMWKNRVCRDIESASSPRNSVGYGIQFAVVASKFKMIDDETGRIPIFIPQGPDAELLRDKILEIDRQGGKLFRGTLRDVQRFTVLATEKFLTSGHIRRLCSNKNSDAGVLLLEDMGLYDEETGLEENLL